MSEPLLDVRDLSVFYGKVEAVHRMSMAVDEGRIVTVIGPNGAGKTTLLGAFTRRRDPAGTRRTLVDVYERFPRLAERREQLAGTLSGGERQMLALGRALMARPKLLMLDEPSLGLAPLIVREIFAIVGELRAAGVSILLVEQNARAALQVADVGYVLETGECVVEGPSRDLAANPRVAATYLGAAVAQV